MIKALEGQYAWPDAKSGRVEEQPDESWSADCFHRLTGNWPTETNGSIPGVSHENWGAIGSALKDGNRGLRRSSLTKLLAKKRGVRRYVRESKLAIRQILTWTNEFHARTGKWPEATSGPIPEASDETWFQVNDALVQGKRGLALRTELLIAKNGLTGKHPPGRRGTDRANVPAAPGLPRSSCVVICHASCPPVRISLTTLPPLDRGAIAPRARLNEPGAKHALGKHVVRLGAGISVRRMDIDGPGSRAMPSDVAQIQNCGRTRVAFARRNLGYGERPRAEQFGRKIKVEAHSPLRRLARVCHK